MRTPCKLSRRIRAGILQKVQPREDQMMSSDNNIINKFLGGESYEE